MLKKYIAMLCIVVHFSMHGSAWPGLRQLGSVVRSACNRGTCMLPKSYNVGQSQRLFNGPMFGNRQFLLKSFGRSSNIFGYGNRQFNQSGRPGARALGLAGVGLGFGAGYYLTQNRPVLAQEKSEVTSSTGIAENLFNKRVQRLQQKMIVDILDYLASGFVSAPEKSLSEMADVVVDPLSIASSDFILDRAIYNIRYAYDHAPRSADIQDEVRKFLHILAQRDSAFIDEAVRTIDRLNSSEEYRLKAEYRRIAQDLKNYLESLRVSPPSMYNFWGLWR